MERPAFDTINDYSEFEKYYWYREELIRICKEHGLKSSGSKIELLKVIEAFFDGNKILPDKKTIRDKNTQKSDRHTKELTLDTGLIECGFTFGNRFREFFSAQTGDEKFKFNVDMVATVKAVKEENDISFTLGDLLEIYYGKKEYVKYDRSELKWNKFVKDFHTDKSTAVYKERLKAAAALWKIVRDSDMKKEYSHELYETYKENLTEYI